MHPAYLALNSNFTIPPADLALKGAKPSPCTMMVSENDAWLFLFRWFELHFVDQTVQIKMVIEFLLDLLALEVIRYIKMYTILPLSFMQDFINSPS